jgi:hypothetical protein
MMLGVCRVIPYGLMMISLNMACLEMDGLRNEELYLRREIGDIEQIGEFNDY